MTNEERKNRFWGFEAAIEKAFGEEILSPGTDLKKAKFVADFLLAAEAHDIALRRIELAERKAFDPKKGQPFTTEETTKGFDIFLGRESAE
jgi:hypothetical protein